MSVLFGQVPYFMVILFFFLVTFGTNLCSPPISYTSCPKLYLHFATGTLYFWATFFISESVRKLSISSVGPLESSAKKLEHLVEYSLKDIEMKGIIMPICN